MAALFLTFVFLLSFVSSQIQLLGKGSPTLQPVMVHWNFTYSLLKPDVAISFSDTTALLELQSYVDGTATEDFGFIDVNAPSPANYAQSQVQAFPLAISALVPMTNLPLLPSGQSILLTRWALAEIFSGGITNWRDPEILCTNRNLDQYLPNATITVVYRSDAGGVNILWMKALSSFNSQWNATYPPSITYPPALQALPNFVGEPGTLQLAGRVVSTPNSIGYCGWYNILRDYPSTQYAALVNAAGTTIYPSATALTAAFNSEVLTQYLSGSPVVDSPDPNAWPITSPLHVIISTASPDYTRARETYKFFRWILTDPSPRSLTAADGYAPLPVNLTDIIMKRISTIQSNGKLLSAWEELGNRNSPIFVLFMSLAVFIFVGVCVLSILHVHQFRTTQINLIYSLVFVVGSTLTLFAPLIWFLVPKTDGICQARLWLTSLGFTILLGTMFSRTWQLRDIYLLQKNSNVEALKYNISLRSSLIKLAITIVVVLLINVVILLFWTTIDPFRAEFKITDNLNLQGKWLCTSHYLETWLGIEVAFILALILFGVFVIYQTWSFQRKVLMVETRWVLIALYNIVLNVAVVAPFVAVASLDDLDISLIAMISIDFSGVGIVLAILLPRLIEKLEWGSHGSDKEKGADSAGLLSSKSPKKKSTKTSKLKSKDKESSRTPAEELSQRLAQPTSPYPGVEHDNKEGIGQESIGRGSILPGQIDESIGQGQLELVSLQNADESTRQALQPSPSQEEGKDGLRRTHEADSPVFVVREEGLEDADAPLSWSNNPISLPSTDEC